MHCTKSHKPELSTTHSTYYAWLWTTAIKKKLIINFTQALIPALNTYHTHASVGAHIRITEDVENRVL